jgi:hypothetical protein
MSIVYAVNRQSIPSVGNVFTRFSSAIITRLSIWVISSFHTIWCLHQSVFLIIIQGTREGDASSPDAKVNERTKNKLHFNISLKSNIWIVNQVYNQQLQLFRGFILVQFRGFSTIRHVEMNELFPLFRWFSRVIHQSAVRFCFNYNC